MSDTNTAANVDTTNRMAGTEGKGKPATPTINRNAKLFALAAKLGVKPRCRISGTVDGVKHSYQFNGSAYTSAQLDKLATNSEAKYSVKSEDRGLDVSNSDILPPGTAAKHIAVLREMVKESTGE